MYMILQIFNAAENNIKVAHIGEAFQNPTLNCMYDLSAT